MRGQTRGERDYATNFLGRLPMGVPYPIKAACGALPGFLPKPGRPVYVLRTRFRALRQADNDAIMIGFPILLNQNKAGK